MAERSGLGILRPLKLRDFRMLWFGQTISFIGDGIYLVAIATLIYDDMGASPSVFALVGIAWSVPQVLLLLASGALSDRMDRRHLMIAGDLLRLFAIAVLGVLVLQGEPSIPVLVGLVFLYGVGAAAFAPSFNAIIPSLVPDDHRVEANSVGQVVRPLAMFVIGPMIGGLLVEIDTGVAFLADAATFAISAVCIQMIRARPDPDAMASETHLFDDMRDGLRYVRSRAWIFYGLIGTALALLVVWAPWEVLMPYVITEDLGGSGVALSLVFAAGGVGSVIVGVYMAQRNLLPRRPFHVLYLAFAVGMGMTAGFGLISAVWQAMIVAFIAEGAMSLLIVIWFTVMQRLVPDDMLGRVSSLDWMISIGLAPLSFAFVGPVSDAIGVRETLILAGVLGAAAVLTIMFIPAATEPERDGSLALGEPSPAAP